MPPFAFSSNHKQQTLNAMNQDSGEPPPPKPPTTAPDSGDPNIIIPQIPVTPAPEQVNLNCPRCNSTNTKFCYYYDNYNLSQARHFCKSCRRSWIKVTSDSFDRRCLNQPPVPAVSTPEQEDNHKCRPCKPLKSPATVAMSPVDRRKRPIPAAPKPDPENLPCPRCNSANTKFCYYNNYNLSQPRYFCRVCRRYWTKGGILRDIPEGSGIARRYGRRARMRADPAPMASDYQPPLIIGDCEAPEEASSEGDRKIEVQESSGEPFLNGWSLGSREQGSEFSISAGFEEMGFGRPVWQQ